MRLRVPSAGGASLIRRPDEVCALRTVCYHATSTGSRYVFLKENGHRTGPEVPLLNLAGGVRRELRHHVDVDRSTGARERGDQRGVDLFGGDLQFLHRGGGRDPVKLHVRDRHLTEDVVGNAYHGRGHNTAHTAH